MAAFLTVAAQGMVPVMNGSGAAGGWLTRGHSSLQGEQLCWALTLFFEVAETPEIERRLSGQTATGI